MNEETISISDVLHLLRVIRWHALAGFLAGGLLALALSFAIKPVYAAKVTLIPLNLREPGADLGDVSSQLGGLAALAGINLSGGDDRSQSIEYLKSRSYAERFIKENHLLPVILADKWDASQRKWRDPSQSESSLLTQATRRFQKSVQVVTEDKRTRVVTVRMEWEDPAAAQRWANDFVRMANDEMRTRVINESRAALGYLSQQIEKTTSVEVREALYRIVESQLKTGALAKVRDQYAFQVIDPAYLPDKTDRVRPNRPLICIAGALLGALLLSLPRLRRRNSPV